MASLSLAVFIVSNVLLFKTVTITKTLTEF
jgi:hypothetical protein